MKRYSNRRRRYARRSPGVGAWLLLIAAWIIALPTAVFVGCLILRTEPVAVPVSVRKASVQEVAEKPFEIVAAFRHIPAINRLRGEQPTILIYHTHTTEAYTKTEQNPYRESGAWRTKDDTKNVVAVGEALKEILERDYGFNVLHDTTDHEPPKLATSYERSLLTMQAYKDRYPSIVLYLDIHRDAYNAEHAPTDFLTINGTETAKLMFVVGKGEKYAEKPYFASNCALAEKICAHLRAIDPKLARPIRIKPGRYNQHVAPNCLLVEVGHNANTLEQALAAMPHLAESISYAFGDPSITQDLFVPN